MTICIVVALKAEATPLIDAFNLKAASSPAPFPIWENEGVKLIISGVGRVRAGAACSYLAGADHDRGWHGWLNVGIGGHPTLPVNTPLFAHKIVDKPCQTEFFPSFPFDFSCDTSVCLTVDSPTTLYEGSFVHDMEAAGFFTIATQISPLELVHVFKVISDNRENPAKNINKRVVRDLIATHIGIIQDTLSEMDNLITRITPQEIPFLDTMKKRWHFSASETHQLSRLLQRWQMLCPDRSPLSSNLPSQRGGKGVLRLLQAYLNEISLR